MTRPPPQAILIASVILVVGLTAISMLALRSTSDGMTTTEATAADQPATAAQLPPAPPASRTPSDLAGIRSSMQSFIDAFNSRDLTRIRVSVCSTVREQVTSPPEGTDDLVLEDLSAVAVTGDFARSQVVTHLESGTHRSSSTTNAESFVREGGAWYFCPGSHPDIGT